MKKLTRVLAAVTALILAAGSSEIFYVAAEEKQQDIIKNETVYVIADSQGNKKNIIVSDWLDNEGSVDHIKDKSELSDIENVKGDEKFTENGDNFEWSADGSDIYYKGTSDKDLPVDVSVTYFLDGKEISPDELAGKSGRVTIRYDYTNNKNVSVKSGSKNIDMYVPFLMLSAAILDSSKFSNIEVTNGQYISDGERFIVVGMALPGLSDSLGFNEKEDLDVEFPEHFEFSANVEDFSIASSFTVATNDIFSNIDMEDTKTLDDLEDKLNEMVDAAKQLTDGSSDLYDGIKALLSGTGELKSGTVQLQNGAEKLNGGASELSNGSVQIENGAGTIASGISDLYDGIYAAKDGSDSLEKGAKQLSDGISPLLNGASTLDDGIAAALDGSSKIETGARNLSSGTSQLASGAKTFSESVKALDDGIAAAKSGSAKLKSGLESASLGIDELATGAAALKDGAGSLSSGLDTASSSLDQTILYNKQVLDSLKSYYQNSGDESLLQLIGTLEQTISSQEQISASMKTEGSLKNGAVSLESGA